MVYPESADTVKVVVAPYATDLLAGEMLLPVPALVVTL
jgi:hypothetical protein